MFTIAFDVNKSVSIQLDQTKVFQSIGNFDNWPKWSPWLLQEPGCSLKVGGEIATVGHSQHWDGNVIGAGNMTITKAVANDVLEYALVFTKPWKSKNQTGFRLTPEGDGTKVHWWMRGTIPFFLFFMKKSMSAWVGSDYERGLAMLKEYLETGEVRSETTVKGVVDRPAMYYIGKRRVCDIKDLGPAMTEDLTALGGLLEKSIIPASKQVFSIYHKYDMVKEQCEYTSGFVYESLQKAPDGCVDGHFPAHRAVAVEHRGPYRHLGNAWTTAMGHARTKNKMDKSIPMYELYMNNPQETDEKDHLVEVYVPVRKS